jgi:CRP/FNR family cyclic AMP-dependent transcriptional regulator
VFYIQKGRVKLTVVSHRGKEAVVAIFDHGNFFGEGCLAGQPLRMSTATVLGEATIIRITKQAMIRLLHSEPEFAEIFIVHLVSRNSRLEEDLVDQLFNSAEKRLARTLLLLARYGKESNPEPVVPKISQETPAAMVGTTRSRISHFMNKFRSLGLIDCDLASGRLEVHNALLNVVLHD